MQEVDWPYENTESGGGKAGGNGFHQSTIADFLSQNKVGLVINLPTRNGGSRAASSFMTQVSVM